MTKAWPRPSTGFLLLVVSYSILIATLAWGLSVPELDRVWAIMQSMQRNGFSGLQPKEEQTLQLALSHYPTLARAFIGRSPIGFVEPVEEGWVSLSRVHLIRGSLAQSSMPLDIECDAPSDAYPATVIIGGKDGSQEVIFQKSGHQIAEFRMLVPSSPELIPVRVTSARGSQGIRIRINAKGNLTKVSP